MPHLNIHERNNPCFFGDSVKSLAQQLYGLNIAEIKELDSYADQNFYLKDINGKEFVFRIANPAETIDNLDMQLQAMQFLAHELTGYSFPAVTPTCNGESISKVKSDNGTGHLVHLLTFLPGKCLDDVPMDSISAATIRSTGSFLGAVDKALSRFSHRATNRFMIWDLKNFHHITPYLKYIDLPQHRSIVEHFLLQFDLNVVPLLPDLPMSVVHNDANDANLLVRKDNDNQWIIKGIIDFGDMLNSFRVCELAIAIAYACLGKENVLETACLLLEGYHQEFPLNECELRVLMDLVCTRLCISATMSSFRSKLEPNNPYILISQEPAWKALEAWLQIDPFLAFQKFLDTCAIHTTTPPVIAFTSPTPPNIEDVTTNNKKIPRSKEDILETRKRFLNPSLSVSYKKPLKIVRGWRQYLYDEDGRAYLDGVNNVCHVGHCHPRVVRAAQNQMAILNTNTRYLHDNIVEYAERLCSTLPAPLRVCFFVNSGSEANDLALRLARTYTGSKETIVLDHAYHGNLTSLIEISPYKFDGPGGSGPAPYIHKVTMPDVYRGPYKTTGAGTGQQYAAEVEKTCKKLLKEDKKPGAFICESLPGVGGQIVLPVGYLAAAFQPVRQAGGVCIADEVQVGFGRIGSDFWGFQAQGVIPDIVTFGKPIGNGHPLGAVVTTAEIAGSFHNGMEYFNTFGGNPVSCAVGLAVMDVIEEEDLQQNALETGEFLKDGLLELKKRHPLIGDVRGMGLFLGIELVNSHDLLDPAAKQASLVVEKMKDQGILLSVDGPLHNVLKIKPPIVFNKENAEHLVSTLDEILSDKNQELYDSI